MPAAGFGFSPSSEGVRRFTLQSPAGSPHQVDPNQKRFSILLVEDNQADAGLVREALEEHGVQGELIVISDGEDAVRFIEALDTAPAACPHLVIVDLNLPKVSGFEVLKTMRRSVRCQDATVLILSSSDMEHEKAEAIRLGASLYVRKPLRLQEFFKLGELFKSILQNPRHGQE